MSLPVKKIIERVGKPVGVINSTGGGGRSMPSEGAAEAVKMVIEQRGMARTITDSSGTEHQVDIEFRAVPDAGAPEIRGAIGGETATILDHPDAGRFRVLQTFVEDVDVLVINAAKE